MFIQKSTVGGVTIEYSRMGLEHRETILFLHGLGPNLRQFEPQVKFFSKSYQVLVVSLRGHGGSSVPEKPRLVDFSMERYALDIQLLLSQLGIGRVHVVGNSMGGLIGFKLIQMNEGLLASLTTFGTTAELHSSSLLVWTLTSITKILGPKGLAMLVSSSMKDKNLARQISGMIAQANKQALIFSEQQIAEYDYTPLLGKIHIPYLLLQSDLDREINAQLSSTLLALGVNPCAKTVVVKGGGHFLNMERPETFNQILGGFLKGTCEYQSDDGHRK